MAPLTSHHHLPPFPSDIRTAPLVSISLAQLEAGDASASAAFFQASKDLGFFYLDMLGSELGEQIVAEAERLNAVQKVFFKLPNNTKDIYGRPHLDPFYAYRYREIESIKDERGAPIRSENYNMRKDDILGNCERLACHAMILENQDLLHSYTLHCRAAIDLMLEHLNTHLELAPGTLAKLHRIHERSGDHVRFTQSPICPYDEDAARGGQHTDFGSITILFNWLGGLQIRMPDTEDDWVYVRPVPGSCVVNLGDALVKFSAGLLRSNIHRVVPPPGEQAGLVRNSLVFFSRPEDAVVLRRLEGGIVDAQPRTEAVAADDEGWTSHDWIMAKSQGKLPKIYTPKGFEYTEEDRERMSTMSGGVDMEAPKISGVA